MAVTGLKSSKVTMYKMVSLPTTASGTKDSGMKASQLSYKAFTTGLNRIGATINSTIVINKQIRDALVANLKLKDKEFEEEKKRFQKEKEEKNKVVKKGGGFPSSGVGKVAEKVAGGFLEGLLGLGAALMRVVITQSVLRWIGNPANMQKLVSIVQTIVSVVTFFSRFLRDNIVKMFDGLATMLDGKKNIFEKLGGFVTFLTGFGSILGAALIIKKPMMVINGVKWVLQTLWDSLTKTKGSLNKRVRSRGSRLPGGGGRGRAAAAAATIAIPLVVGAVMAGGKNESSSSSSQPPTPSTGSQGQPSPPATPAAPKAPPEGGSNKKDSGGFKLPWMAQGGIATKPTEALLGEAGPELRIPDFNLNVPGDNAKRMRDAGIKPLSSLGGMMKGSANGGGQSSKQAQKLSDLFMAPFRGIGAGILANVSSVVTGMGPAGQLLTPILGNIIAPVANSFGVPPSLVKTLKGKSPSPKQFSGKQFTGNQFGKGSSEKLFGKGKLINEKDKKFKKVADTSVLGLLSNILAAIQVIGNKAGGGGDTSTTTPPPTGSTPPPAGGDNPQTSSGAQKSGSGGPTNTASDTIKKAGGFREDGTLKGITGTTKDKGRAGREHSPGAGLLPVEGSNRTLWYNESGDVFKWQRPGDPLTDITSSSLISPQELKGTLVRDLKDGKVKLLSGMFGGDQTPVGYFSYAMGAILKKRGNSGQGRSKTGATKDEWEKPKDGLYGPTIKPKASTPSKAMGGWISGPQSGYPVSLSEGGGTDFIGHGTEWVGFKKAAGGAAFVVPFDTPATKNNPGLTGSRMRQAKQGGYALPNFASGGALDKIRESKNAAKKKRAAGGEVIPNVKNSSHWSAGIPLVSIRSKSGKSAKVAKALSNRFQGFINDLEATGYKIDELGGFRGDEKRNVDGKGSKFAHTWGAAIDINWTRNPAFVGKTKGDFPANVGQLAAKHGLGWGSFFDDAMHFSAMKRERGAGINGMEIDAASKTAMGGEPGALESTDTSQTASASGSTDTTEPADTLESVSKKLADAVFSLNSSLGYAPPANSVDKATADAAQAKADKDKAAKDASSKASGKAIEAAAKASAAAGKSTNAPSPTKPVVLPGPSTILPVEIAWASTTSLYQPRVTFT